jgi:hypothetical protein
LPLAAELTLELMSIRIRETNYPCSGTQNAKKSLAGKNRGRGCPMQRNAGVPKTVLQRFVDSSSPIGGTTFHSEHDQERMKGLQVARDLNELDERGPHCTPRRTGILKPPGAPNPIASERTRDDCHSG